MTRTFALKKMPKFHCIHCGQRIDAPESMAGMKSACPSCNAEIQVPGSPLPSSTATAARPRSAKRPRSAQPRTSRNQPTRHSNTNIFLRFTTFRGRIDRLQYFYGWLLKIGLIFLGGGLLIVLESAVTENTAMIIVLPLCLGVMWINLSLQARRLHDMNRTAWWLLLYLVPFVNYVFAFVLYIFCFFQPGTRKENKYGESPEPIFGQP